jgi:hypothetical protein
MFLERETYKNGFLIPSCGSTLLCGRCLKPALSEFHRFFPQSQIPLGDDETEKHSLMRQLGIVAIPISLATEEWQVLLEYLNGIEGGASRGYSQNSRDSAVSLP